jgi:hypothetical protein
MVPSKGKVLPATLMNSQKIKGDPPGYNVRFPTAETYPTCYTLPMPTFRYEISLGRKSGAVICGVDEAGLRLTPACPPRRAQRRSVSVSPGL